MDKKDMLRLSIVVNMYNTAQYMPRCMESLLEQDISSDEYEIILVNDGSPDNSLELANEYAAKYPNIVVCSHENKGLAGARNTGLDAAKGKYLRFVDPDDYIEKNSLSYLLDRMDEEELDMLRFNYWKVDDKYNLISDCESEAAFDYSSKIMSGNEYLSTRLGMACYVWPYIYNLQFVRDSGVRFFERCYFDDVPFLPILLQKAKRVNCVGVRHYYYLQRQGSMVRVNTLGNFIKKMNGNKLIMCILSEQRESINNSGVRKWYDAMIAHSTLTFLGMVISSDYFHIDEAIIFLKRFNILPITTYKATKKARRKIILLNFSPKLYCWLLHIIYGGRHEYS